MKSLTVVFTYFSVDLVQSQASKRQSTLEDDIVIKCFVMLFSFIPRSIITLTKGVFFFFFFLRGVII